MRINQNVAALNAWRNLSQTDLTMSKSLERLSSGLRINKAADDAAGLAISEKMRSQVRGLNQAVRNSQDGISMIQTAEGAMAETHSILQRMRELAVQSSTSTLTDSDRDLLQAEFDQLQQELTTIGDVTMFNGKNLLDGSAGVTVTSNNTNVKNMRGTGDTKAGSYDYTSATLATAGVLYIGDVSAAADFSGTGDTFTTTQTITVNGKSYSVTGGSTTVQGFMDLVNADTAVTGVKASYDSTNGEIKFETSVAASSKSVKVTTSVTPTGRGIATTLGGTDASTDADETDFGTDATITGGALGALQYSAEGNVITIRSGNAKGLTFKVGDTATATLTVSTNNAQAIQTGAQAGQTTNFSINDVRASALGVDALSISTKTNATDALTSLDEAITTVSTERAKLGAVQNRLEHTIQNLTTAAENLTAAESRIRDVDMASEMAMFTRAQILLQAGTAMMAQANMKPQNVLQLLR